jgi:uroporphyrin-III C-methyltransferase
LTVSLVGAGPGDPGLLTLKGADLLSRAEVVVYDRLIGHELLALAPSGAQLLDVGKGPGASTSQAQINHLLIEHGRSGRRVVRLKGGDPFVFGRGGEEAEALMKAGVDFEIVPGVTSAFAAPALAGIPVTHRGLATSVSVITGHVGDGSAAGTVDWSSFGRTGGTLVILMGMAHRAEIAADLIDCGRDASTPVAVVHWGTTARQRVIRSTLADLAAVDLPAPSVIVIGPVAEMDFGHADSSPHP